MGTRLYKQQYFTSTSTLEYYTSTKINVLMEELIRGAPQDVIHDKESMQREMNMHIHTVIVSQSTFRTVPKKLLTVVIYSKRNYITKEKEGVKTLLCILHTLDLKFLHHVQVCFTCCNFIILSHQFEGQNASPNYNEH